MSLFAWDPFAELDTLQRRLDRLYNFAPDTPALEDKRQSTDLSRIGEGGALMRPLGVWRPHIDVKETNKEIVMHADVPGVSEKDLNVSIDNNILTLSGTREAKKDEKSEHYHRIERSYGSFSRSIQLPEGIDPANVKAHFDNGVLEVRVPKPQQAKTKKISISGRGEAAQVQQQEQQQVPQQQYK